ncbi:hypothetical protein STEG23_010633 [Scotinomys teguina]
MPEPSSGPSSSQLSSSDPTEQLRIIGSLCPGKVSVETHVAALGWLPAGLLGGIGPLGIRNKLQKEELSVVSSLLARHRGAQLSSQHLKNRGVPGGFLLEDSRPCPIDTIRHHRDNKESFDGQPVADFICYLNTGFTRSPPNVQFRGAYKELWIEAYLSFMAPNSSLVMSLQELNWRAEVHQKSIRGQDVADYMRYLR